MGPLSRLLRQALSGRDPEPFPLLSRQQGQYTARIEEASVQVQNNKAPAGMKGYFCFKLKPGEAVEVRGLVVQVGR